MLKNKKILKFPGIGIYIRRVDFGISRGLKNNTSGLLEIGSTEHLYGATTGGIVKYRRSASLSRQA